MYIASCVLGVLLAEAAVEDDDLERRVVLDAERVLGALLALVDLLRVVIAAAGTGGEHTHRRHGDQSECRRPLDQVTPSEIWGGSHAQVLAFVRTQAV